MHIHPRIQTAILFCTLLLPLCAPITVTATSPPKKLATNTEAKTIEQVTLQLKWHHQFQFAGYYAALEKGFYWNEGLDVTIMEGGPHAAVDQLVISGVAQYGVLASELIEKRLLGEPLVLLSVIFQHSIRTLITLEGYGISAPSDLPNKPIMLNNNERVELMAMFAHEGIQPAQLSIQPKDDTAIDKLTAGDIVAINGSMGNQPYTLRQLGYTPRLIRPINYGIDFYGDSLFTTENEISQHPHRAAAFRRASIQGWYYAMKHPQEIIELIIQQYAPDKTREQLQFEADSLKPVILPDLVDIGHVNPGRIKQIAETYKHLKLVSGELSLDDFIYDPDRKADYSWMLWAFGLASVISMILILINHRLKAMVDQRTEQLVAANRALTESETTLKKSLKNTEEARKRIDTILRSINDGLIAVNPLGRIVLINQQAKTMLGFPKEVSTTESIGTLHLETALDQQISKTLSSGTGPTTPVEWAPRTKSGKNVVIRARTAPMLNEQGQLTGSISILYDITQERALDQVKTELISTAAHELRTPLTAIMGFIELLRDDNTSPEQTEEYLRIVYDKCDHLEVLISDLLDLARIESGQPIRTTKKRQDIIPLITQSIESFRHTSIRPLNLSVPDGAIQVLLDEGKFSQVINNLISNADKFSPENSAIQIACHQQGSDFVMTVTDEGIGMTDEQVERMFDKFYRADSSSTARGGLGLGMAITHNIVEAHQGRIEVESQPQKGTTIRVFLPIDI